MAKARTPRSRWIEVGLDALAAGGPDAVRVEPLAAALGVTKGGFYWHFADRRALLEEMLEVWERRLVDEVIEQIEGEGGDARAKLRHLFGLAGSAAAQGLMQAELAIRDWARRDPDVADRLRRVDNRRMDYMRGLFAEIGDPEARSFISMALFVGNHFVAADHGDRSREDVMRDALRLLLAS
jgi:AcrR family transcriptional regulator